MSHLTQRTGKLARGLNQDVRRVKVLEIVGGQHAVCQDDNNVQIEVPYRVRAGKAAWPMVGETWIIHRFFGGWTFGAAIIDTPPPVISATRAGASALTVQLLEALAELGLVDDQTIPSPEPEDSI